MVYSTREIQLMPYAQFVSVLGFDNKPPGGHETIKFWKTYAQIDQKSRILDVGCNTGFSARELTRRTKCTSFGIDSSSDVIDKAIKREDRKFVSRKVTFSTGNVESIKFKSKFFTHIIAGSTFGFYRDREKALSECSRVLAEDGKFCSSLYFFHKVPPQRLLNQVNKLLGTNLVSEGDRQYWDELYNTKFTLVERQEQEPWVVSETRLYTVCKTLIEESAKLKSVDREMKQACLQRFYAIRCLINELREFQTYDQAVYKKK